MKQKILVVEDEGIIAKNLQNALQRLGYTVPAITFSGQDAIDQAEALRPDLVLMDIVLKGAMDGIQAAEQIRTCYDIPVIFLTAYADDKTLERAKVTEPFGYILKPFSERELCTNIEMALYKHQMEHKLRVSEEYFRTMIENASDLIAILDREGVIRYASPSHKRMLGCLPQDLVGTPVSQYIHPEDLPAVYPAFEQAIQDDSPLRTAEMRVQHQDGSWHMIEASIQYRFDDPVIQGIVVNSRDVTLRKQAELEREKLIHELQDALDKVKTLSGLLPICSVCKKIRDDTGYWNQLEVYIRDHSEAEFTHSICPDCAKRLYPELFEDDE